MGAEPTPDEVVIAEESPLSADARMLDQEMAAFTEQTYPEDAAIGNIALTVEEMARTGRFVVARIGGAPAGCGAVVKHDDVDGQRVMEARRMYVRAAFRGRRVAERVLSRLEAIAADEGAARVILLCGPRQPSALQLYARCGYRERAAFGAYRTHPLNIFLEKTLVVS
jgi:putative acetyltransferase